MGIKIIDLVRHQNEDRTVSFDTILFEDTEKDRWLLATVDSIDFPETRPGVRSRFIAARKTAPEHTKPRSSSTP